jgi:hypothetical protein
MVFRGAEGIDAGVIGRVVDMIPWRAVYEFRMAAGGRIGGSLRCFGGETME